MGRNQKGIASPGVNHPRKGPENLIELRREKKRLKFVLGQKKKAPQRGKMQLPKEKMVQNVALQGKIELPQPGEIEESETWPGVLTGLKGKT